MSSTSMVREVYSESGQAVSFISVILILSGKSVWESHSCAFPELSARHPSIVRTANNTTFPIRSLFIMTEADKKIACNSHYFLMTALDCLYGTYVTARYAKA